jgi:gamma-glutamyltranspeptidase / glutathione hydrolase
MEVYQMDWTNSYNSRRTPVFGANVVATSQPLAAQAGIRMLLRGGNAVDAALATAIALTVVEPTMNGVGGDAFALVWEGGRLHALNASGRSPRAWRYDMFRGLAEMPALGWGSVTVPGAVSAWVALSKRFGVLPFAELFRPAIEYATHGFPVSPYIAANWASAAPKYAGFDAFESTFLPHGRPPRAGETFRCPELAFTLAEISETYGESFYVGRLAREIAGFSQETGGSLREEDLASHEPQWVEPVGVEFDEYTLHEMPPNSQGIAAPLALALLRDTDVRTLHPDSPESLELQLRAMHVAHTFIRERVADPEAMECLPDALLTDATVQELQRRMLSWPQRASRADGGRSEGDTVYLTAADSGGCMVSFIQSNYYDFGSGLVVPGTGISLHSRAACFSLEPRHPNVVAGGKRPFHTLCPAFVTHHGRPAMSFGVMGGPMQPQGHLQTFLRLFAQGQNPQTACDAPRWHVAADGTVLLEAGVAPSTVAALTGRGFHVDMREYGDPVFGGGQFALALDSGYCAASDPRRDGQAVVL